MSQAAIDAMALAATKRLKEFINRTAAQQSRRMVEGWRKAS
jgi:hypothetical protein